MDTISIDNVLLVPLRVSEEDYINFIKENPTGLGANFIQDQWYNMVQEDQIVEVFHKIGDIFTWCEEMLNLFGFNKGVLK